jgi:hypothetical protein
LIAKRVSAAAFVVVCALSSVACDQLIGLNPTILVVDAAGGTDVGLADAPADVAPDVVPDVVPVKDASPDAPPDAMACTPCPDGCVDTTSDGHNCGACGHDCLGSTCRAGACVPATLVAGSPADLAVDQDSVYWTDGTSGDVKRCPIAGCADGGETLFVGGGTAAAVRTAGITLQSGQVIFAENIPNRGTVYECPTDGCAGAPAVVGVEVDGQVGAVAADAMFVYWTSNLDSSVHVCPMPGCTMPTVLGAGSVDPLDPWGLVVRDGRFYFALGGRFTLGMNGVGNCSLAGCTCSQGACMLPSPVGAAAAPATAIAAGPSGITWTSASANQIFDNPIGTNAPAGASLLAAATVPGRIATDPDDNVYFTTAQPAAIRACAAGGCNGNPTVAMAGMGPIGDIAVDAKRVYAVVGTQTNQLTPAPASSMQPAAPIGTAIVWVAK